MKVEFPVQKIKSDVCVVGGGMAGVCAAIASARNGAKTVLLQDRPVLGGNASSEIRMWICGASGADNKEAGLLEEIQLENYYRNPQLTYTVWDHVVYGKCLEAENLTVLLNCAVMDLSIDTDVILSVRCWHLTRQCYVHVTAKFYIDCSGDSVLRASGAEYRTGRESSDVFGESHAPKQADGKTMGNSILIQLRETDIHVPFIPPAWAYSYTEADLPNRNLKPTGGNFWWLETGGVKDTITDADDIRDELLKIAYGVWALIKNHPDGRGRNWELDWIGSLPGKRENIRYVGDHVLTQNDVAAMGRFDDCVIHGGWSMDDHHPDAILHSGPPTIFHPAPSPYGIPYRCLYSKNIANLFFAGRNISATHMAMSSTRVMATTAMMGQAAGTAAAMAVSGEVSPRDIYKHKIKALQACLMDQDVYIPWETRSIAALTREAHLTASAGDPAPLTNGIDRSREGHDNGWWGKADHSLMLTWTKPVSFKEIRLVFDSNFADPKKMMCRYPKQPVLAEMPKMLTRDFDIDIERDGQWQPIHVVRDNRRRLVFLPVSEDNITGCRMRIKRTWGDSDAHVFAFEAR